MTIGNKLVRSTFHPTTNQEFSCLTGLKPKDFGNAKAFSSLYLQHVTITVLLFDLAGHSCSTSADSSLNEVTLLLSREPAPLETCSVGRINWITELFVPNEQYLFKTSIIYSFRSSSFRGQFLTFSRRKGCCLNDLSIHRDRDRRQSLKFIPKVVFVIFLMARQTAENQKSAVSCKLLSQSTCCFLC